MTEQLRKVTVYLTPDEYAHIAEEADAEGVTVSAYCRARLLGVVVRYRGRPKAGPGQPRKTSQRRS